MLRRLIQQLRGSDIRTARRASRPRFRPGVERLEGRDTPSLMGGPFQVSHDRAPDPAVAPATASSANGMSAVAWEYYRTEGSSDEAVYLQLFNADGGKRGTPIPVTSVSRSEQFFRASSAVAMDNAGNTVIAWVQSGFRDSRQHDVWAARYDANGNLLARALVAGTALNEYDPSVAVSGDGTDILITYSRDASAGNADVIGRRFTASWGTVSSFFVANTPANEFRARAARRTDADRGFAIAYETGADVLLKRYAGNGALLGTHVVASGPRLQQVPRLDVDNGGNAVVVWQEYWDGQWNLFARRVTGAGDLLPTFAVITTTRDETLADVAVNKITGEFVITFQSRDGTSGPARVYVMEFTAGAVRTATHNLGEPLSGPAVSINEARRYLVAYVGPTIGFGGILGQEFNTVGVFGQYGVL